MQDVENDEINNLKQVSLPLVIANGGNSRDVIRILEGTNKFRCCQRDVNNTDGRDDNS